MSVSSAKTWFGLRTFGIIAVGLLTAVAVNAQITWNFTDGTLNASSVATNLTVSALVAHNVGNGTASVNATSANGSGTNNLAMSATLGTLNLATSSYYEFTITAADGFRARINALTLDTRSSATGPNSVGFYLVWPDQPAYAQNPDNITVSTSANWQTKVFNGNTTVISGPSESLTFRIYGSGGTSSPSAANWRLDNLSLDAVALTETEFLQQFSSPVPEPADYAVGFGLASLVAAALVRAKRRRRQIS